jgi:uncharacterized protein
MSENHDNNDSTTPAKKLHGFAAWSKERQREAASKGGKIAHALGRAHKFSGDEAKEAGQRGGLASAEKKRRMKTEGAPTNTETNDGESSRQ